MPTIFSMLFLNNLSCTETDDQSFAGFFFLPFLDFWFSLKFHWLNSLLLRKNGAVLMNLLHQAAGSDFWLYKTL